MTLKALAMQFRVPYRYLWHVVLDLETKRGKEFTKGRRGYDLTADEVEEIRQELLRRGKWVTKEVKGE